MRHANVTKSTLWHASFNHYYMMKKAPTKWATCQVETQINKESLSLEHTSEFLVRFQDWPGSSLDNAITLSREKYLLQLLTFHYLIYLLFKHVYNQGSYSWNEGREKLSNVRGAKSSFYIARLRIGTFAVYIKHSQSIRVLRLVHVRRHFRRSDIFIVAICTSAFRGHHLDSIVPKSPHRRHCVVVLKQDTFILDYVVLVQHRKTRPCLTERLLMGRKESNQTKIVPKSISVRSRQELWLPSVFVIRLNSNQLQRLAKIHIIIHDVHLLQFSDREHNDADRTVWMYQVISAFVHLQRKQVFLWRDLLAQIKAKIEMLWAFISQIKHSRHIRTQETTAVRIR